MIKAKPANFIGSICLTILGIAVVYFLADDSAELRELKAELDHVKGLQHSQPRQPRTRFTSGGTSFGDEKILPPLRTNDLTVGVDNLLTRANITADDVALTLELQRRQDQGEFILLDETPFLRKVRAYRHKVLAAEAAAKNAEAYNRELAGLGIKPEDSQQLQSHLAKIHHASLEAEEAIAQVLDARTKYDQRVRALLNDEDYSRYRQYEASKPAQMELERIQNYFREEKNTTIAPAYAQALATMIQEASAAENGSWHGPYDSLPQVKMGRDQVVEWEQQRVQQAKDSASEVIERMSSADLPDEYRRFLEDYYAKKVEAMQSSFDAIANALRGDGRISSNGSQTSLIPLPLNP
jgi:hypothetical protein